MELTKEFYSKEWAFGQIWVRPADVQKAFTWQKWPGHYSTKLDEATLWDTWREDLACEKLLV